MENIIAIHKAIFNEIEIKFDLFNFSVSRIKIWQYIRREIFELILEKLKILEKSQDDIDRSILNGIKHFIKSVIYIFLKKDALFYKKENKELLVFNHKKRKLIREKYWEIYTDFFLKKKNLIILF